MSLLLLAGSAAATTSDLEPGYYVFDMASEEGGTLSVRVDGRGGTATGVFAWQGGGSVGATIGIGLNASASPVVWAGDNSVAARAGAPAETRGAVGLILPAGTVRVLIVVGGADIDLVRVAYPDGATLSLRGSGSSVLWHELSHFDEGYGAEAPAYVAAAHVGTRHLETEVEGRFIGAVGLELLSSRLPARSYVLAASSGEGQHDCPCRFYGQSDPDGLSAGPLAVDFTGVFADLRGPVVFGADVPADLLNG